MTWCQVILSTTLIFTRLIPPIELQDVTNVTAPTTAQNNTGGSGDTSAAPAPVPPPAPGDKAMGKYTKVSPEGDDLDVFGHGAMVTYIVIGVFSFVVFVIACCACCLNKTVDMNDMRAAAAGGEMIASVNAAELRRMSVIGGASLASLGAAPRPPPPPPVAAYVDDDTASDYGSSVADDQSDVESSVFESQVDPVGGK